LFYSFSRFSSSTALHSYKSGTTDIRTSNFDIKDNKIRFRNNTKSPSDVRDSRLPFLDVPKGDDLRFHELRLDEEYLLFEAFSKLMAYLQPSGFPLDVLRKVLSGQMPLHLLAIQILEANIVAIIWIFFWAMASLCLPFGVAVSLWCTQHRRLNEDTSIAPLNSEKWIRRILGYSLHVLLILMISPIILILAGNEQISRSISKSPTSASIIYEDVNTFLKNTHMQISFVVTSSTDIAFEEIGKDLDAVHELLGIPYQQELASDTGIENDFAKLEDLKASTYKVTSLVSDLVKECNAAKIASNGLQGQLQDIVQQLTIARQQCAEQDRSLYYTIQISGIGVDFTVENLLNDPEIKQLQLLSTDENFNNSIDGAREAFFGVSQLSLETDVYISDMKAILNKKRTEVYESTHSLDVLARSLSQTLGASQQKATEAIQKVADWDLWRWLAVVVITSIMSLIWGLLLCGAPCGCGVTSRTIPFLTSGVALSCIACLLAWGLGSLALLIAGHGQTMICDPLDDYPGYDVLGEFVDAKGILYTEGLLEDFVDENDTIRIAEVLKQSQRNMPAYGTFHLYNKLNVEHIINYRKWRDLEDIFSNFIVEKCALSILSPSLTTSLQRLSTASALNLTSHRLRASAPTTKRDLGSFADQLNTVARQLSDPASARKMDNIAFHARKVINGELQQLNEIKNGILYKITTLELLLHPLNVHANESLENLKSIQYSLDNDGWKTAEKVRKQFVSRIESCLEELYNYVNVKVTQEIGKSRPLWEMFRSSRFYICKLIVDPLHGISFFCSFSVLLLLTIAPIVIKLVDYYKEDSLLSRDYLIDDQGVWASPSSVPIQEIQITPPEEPLARPSASTWVSPPSQRQPSPHRIPPPPRGRRNHHESLKLVEPISWKTGSTTPRRWI
ncbi:unnamed protein product, partial [Phaedon cochleariae]